MDELKARLTALFREAIADTDPNCVDDACPPEGLTRRAITIMLNEGWRPPSQADAITHRLEDLAGAYAVRGAGRG